jgi:hypothetical protein
VPILSVIRPAFSKIARKGFFYSSPKITALPHDLLSKKAFYPWPRQAGTKK